MKTYNAALQAQLDAYLSEQSGLPQSKAAAMIGVSPTALSQYRNSKYPGDVEAVESKIEEFLRTRSAAAQAEAEKAPYLSAGYVPTSVSEDVYKAIQYCQLERGIVVLHGDAGIGKTRGAARFVQDNPANAIYIRCTPVGGTLTAMLRQLGTALKLPATRNRLELSMAMRIAASADLLTAENGRKRLRDDLFVGLEGSEQTVGITAFAPALRNENYEARRQAYLKAVENLLGVKRGILSDAEAVSKTATEINSSAGDYSLSIIEFQNLYYDALQAALRLADQLGQAYRLCDGTAWDTEVLNVTWGNGVLYDADKEWADRLAMVQQGMLRPELALAWKFDLPCDTEEDLAAIRQKYMPTMQDMES